MINCSIRCILFYRRFGFRLLQGNYKLHVYILKRHSVIQADTKRSTSNFLEIHIALFSAHHVVDKLKAALGSGVTLAVCEAGCPAVVALIPGALVIAGPLCTLACTE